MIYHREFEKIKGNRNKLLEFQKKIANLYFLDPACGCGNFLIITYRELRDLEILVLQELDKTGQLVTDISTIIQEQYVTERVILKNVTYYLSNSCKLWNFWRNSN
jgi:type II restriction/modification system DNA methylase subunit YeeA